METILEKRCKLLVEREVLVNQSMLVEKLLNNGIVNYEDIHNFYGRKCEECGSMEWNDANKNGDVGDTHKQCDNCSVVITNKEWENLKQEEQEIFEWYVVTEWLAEKMKDNGECILESDYELWWGRQCTGQAVYMDNIIEDIVKETEYASSLNE